MLTSHIDGAALPQPLRAPVTLSRRCGGRSGGGRRGAGFREVGPLRVGPVAGLGCGLQQLLHAALAGHTPPPSRADVGDAMAAAGTAWRHLKAAGAWQHEEHLRPPQLARPFRRALELAILLLTYERIASTPLAVCDESRHRRRIELLQAMIACNGPPAVKKWVMGPLAATVAEFWATYHHDPRTPGAARSERNACAIIKPWERRGPRRRST